MIDPTFKDARVADIVTPEILAFLEANQPPADTSPDLQIGHWMGVTAAALGTITETRKQLAHAQQRIRELEADA